MEYVTALGTDSFSDQMIAARQQEQVHTQLVQRLPDKMPGLYFIETDAHGERTFWYWRSDAAARFWLDSPQAGAICQQLAHYDYLYLSGISPAILPQASREKLMVLLSACRQNGGTVIFDNNYRPRLWADSASAQQAYAAMLRHTDIAFLTLDDEHLLWGEQPLADVIARTRRRRAGNCDQTWCRLLRWRAATIRCGTLRPSNWLRRRLSIPPPQVTPSAPVIWRCASGGSVEQPQRAAIHRQHGHSASRRDYSAQRDAKTV